MTLMESHFLTKGLDSPRTKLSTVILFQNVSNLSHCFQPHFLPPGYLDRHTKVCLWRFSGTCSCLHAHTLDKDLQTISAHEAWRQNGMRLKRLRLLESRVHHHNYVWVASSIVHHQIHVSNILHPPKSCFKHAANMSFLYRYFPTQILQMWELAGTWIYKYPEKWPCRTLAMLLRLDMFNLQTLEIDNRSLVPPIKRTWKNTCQLGFPAEFAV